MGVLLTASFAGQDLRAQHSRFATTGSRSGYVHWIPLLDADGKTIDPASEQPRPYSPAKTCGKCHDYAAISHGWHFNALEAGIDGGRPGEPWLWVDNRNGTELPLSFRGWQGTFNPHDVGISEWEFLLKFGQYVPGGVAPPGDGEEGPSKDDPGRWRLSGSLEIDCMICHSHDRSYDRVMWGKQVGAQNFAWAATAALGLAKVDGVVQSLPDDFDPMAEVPAGGRGLPQTVYDRARFNGYGEVFFDVIREPANEACYFCHTSREMSESPPVLAAAGGEAAKEPVEAAGDGSWLHEEDIHLRAGMTCVDCHRNEIGHHTVRGYEGERHPTEEVVGAFSCRGCHYGTDGSPQSGGRLAAPLPEHKGLPPLHLEEIACTTCHSGMPLESSLRLVQMSRMHELGLPSHDRHPGMSPRVTGPVPLMADGVLTLQRMIWPAFWGKLQGDELRPLHPEQAQDLVRRALRVRRDFTEELTRATLTAAERDGLLGPERAALPADELTDDERATLARGEREKAVTAFREKLAEALAAVNEALAPEGATGVYVSGGVAYRLDSKQALETFEHPAAAAYAWSQGHDVRPARQALGIGGCTDCHSAGAALFEAVLTAEGPAPVVDPVRRPLQAVQGFDGEKLAAWNQSFQGRSLFKWLGLASMTVVLGTLLAYGMSGLIGVARRVAGEGADEGRG
jgi:hypothetical protein